jgi:hypothetical protein
MAKYRVIAKVDNDKFVKYYVTNLLLFTKFLDRNFSAWRFFNVYEKSKDDKGKQIASFTKNNRPQSATIGD